MDSDESHDAVLLLNLLKYSSQGYNIKDVWGVMNMGGRVRITERPQRLGMKESIMEVCKHSRRGLVKDLQRSMGSMFTEYHLPEFFESEDFNGKNFSGYNLENFVFSNVSFQGTNLRNTSLSSAKFISADLTGANLAEADLSAAVFKDTTLKDVDFTNTNLYGADLSSANQMQNIFLPKL